MHRLAIPSLTLLGLSMTSCVKDEDPIVGTWDATRIGEQTLPRVVEEYDYSLAIDLVIKTDRSGTYNVHLMDANESSEQSYPLTVEDMAPNYTIQIPMADLILNCTLNGLKLDCTDEEMVSYQFQHR